jgi:hypothetical protein
MGKPDVRGISCGFRDLRLYRDDIEPGYCAIRPNDIDGYRHILRGLVCHSMHTGSAVSTGAGRGDGCPSYTEPTGWAWLVRSVPLTFYHLIFRKVHSQFI